MDKKMQLRLALALEAANRRFWEAYDRRQAEQAEADAYYGYGR